MTAPCYCGGSETTGHAVGCPDPTVRKSRRVAPTTVDPKDGYFVWTKRGKAPRFHHDTLGSAQREADRLARLNPGGKFIVMQAVTKHSVPNPVPAGPDSREGGLRQPSRHVGAA